MSTKQQKSSPRASPIMNPTQGSMSAERPKGKGKPAVPKTDALNEEEIRQILAIGAAKCAHAAMRELFPKDVFAHATARLFAPTQFVGSGVGQVKSRSLVLSAGRVTLHGTPPELPKFLEALVENRNRILKVVGTAVAFAESVPDFEGGHGHFSARGLVGPYLVLLRERVGALDAVRKLVGQSSVLPLVAAELRVLQAHLEELSGMPYEAALEPISAFLRNQAVAGAAFDPMDYPEYPRDIVRLDGRTVAPDGNKARKPGGIQAHINFDNITKLAKKRVITKYSLLNSQPLAPSEGSVLLYYLNFRLRQKSRSKNFQFEGATFTVEQLLEAVRRNFDVATFRTDGVVRGIGVNGATLELRVVTTDLREELARLVAAGLPAGGEKYSERANREEMAVKFFERNYGRFHNAGLLYKDLLRRMDESLEIALKNRGKDAPQIPKKKDRVAKEIDEVSSKSPVFGRALKNAYRAK